MSVYVSGVQLSADNTELACAFIQKTAVEKAVPEMDKRLSEVFISHARVTTWLAWPLHVTMLCVQLRLLHTCAMYTYVYHCCVCI